MTWLFVKIIYFYRWVISPFLAPRCRFEPTCSQYAVHALEHHGFFKGMWLIVKRLSRCHPYNRIAPHFGYDPVPHPKPANKKQRLTKVG